MESKLYEAAGKGNVRDLLELLAQDKQLLDRFMTGNPTETPLHIAAMLGHIEFVKKVLTQKPELARVQNSQGSTPLHLAAAKGHSQIAESLSAVSPELCFVRDKYEKNPLHVAAMKGQVSVLKCLVQERRDAAYSDVEHGQTILHLCVKHNRLEALTCLIEILDDVQFINSTDDDGNTILHLAAAERQTEIMDFLEGKGLDQKEEGKGKVDSDIKNSRGFTASDLFTQGESEERKRMGEDNMHNMLMVVAILVATIAFEAGRETDNFKDHLGMYEQFITCNTLSFILSLSVIMLLISGLPLGRRIPTWMVMLPMWASITFQAATYSIVIEAFSPEGGQYDASWAGQIVVLAWIGLVALIFLYHVVHIIRESLKNKGRCISYMSCYKPLQACSSLKKCCEP